MTHETVPNRGVDIQLFQSHYSAALGTSVTIPFAITNRSEQEDYFEITVEGIPFEWLLLDLPVIFLVPGERREASLVIQTPETSLVSAGEYPIALHAVSQTRPELRADANFHLTVFEQDSSTQVVTRPSFGPSDVTTRAPGSAGSTGSVDAGNRLGVLLNTTQFGASPGDTLTVPMVISNRDLREHTYSTRVDGLPQVWVSTSVPTVRLGPGEHREVLLYIQPSAGAASRAGRYPFTIQVSSISDPSQTTVVEALLTLAAVAQFSTDLSPQPMQSTQAARLRIHNTGNIQDTYTIHFQDNQGRLEFTHNITGPIRLMPGESTAVDFAAAPVRPHLFGSPMVSGFSVVVQAASGETQGQNGEVISRSLIPVWVLPLLGSLCLISVCVLGYIWNFNQNRLTAGQRTAEAELAIIAGQTATAEAFLAFNEATQSAILTATSFALTAMPTDTPTPTETIMPTETETAPTETAPPLPTETFTLTPTLTFTLPPPTETVAPPTATATATIQPLPISSDSVLSFASNREGGLRLYMFTAGDRAQTPMSSSGQESQPVWSPDGSRIAFTSGVDGNNEIYVMNADGSNLVNLTQAPSNESYPEWSPNGSQIAFTSDRDGNNEIYVMNADGSDPQNLTQSPSNDFKPAWYTQGGLLGSTSRILFVTDRDGNFEIYAMDTDGDDPENLTNNPAGETLPSVPYSGGRVAFVSDRDGNLEIYVMDLDGDNQENLTQNPAGDSRPVWSPDGNWIAFTTDRDGNSEVYIMNEEGGELTNLSNNPAEDTDPAWR